MMLSSAGKPESSSTEGIARQKRVIDGCKLADIEASLNPAATPRPVRAVQNAHKSIAAPFFHSDSMCS